jgi:hypothetical protein
VQDQKSREEGLVAYAKPCTIAKRVSFFEVFARSQGQCCELRSWTLKEEEEKSIVIIIIIVVVVIVVIATER